MSNPTTINPNTSQLSMLASKLIPMLEHAKQEHRQDYHYRYLLGTMRYILENLQDDKSKVKGASATKIPATTQNPAKTRANWRNTSKKCSIGK